MRHVITLVTMLLVPLVLATCGSPGTVKSDLAAFGWAESGPAELQQARTETLSTRLVAVDRAVSRWQTASTLRFAHEAAEEARNLDSGSHMDHHHYISGGLVAGVEGNQVRLSANGAESALLEEEEGGEPLADFRP